MSFLAKHTFARNRYDMEFKTQAEAEELQIWK